MSKKAWIYMTVLTAALLSVTGCDRFRKSPGENEAGSGEEVQVTRFAVATTVAVEGEIKDYLQLNGDVTTKTAVDTYAEVSGKLKSLFVKVGDTVRKDQVIAEVDPSKPGMTYVASPVKASIAGTVTQLPVQIGGSVMPSMPIAKISKMDELEVVLYVAERFISKMRPGLPAVIRTDAYPGTVFKGNIREVSPVVDQASRTLEVKLRLNNTSGLKAGMFAEVKLITDEKEGIVKIPVEAMINRFGENYVFVVTDDPSGEGNKLAEKRIIKPGIRVDNQLEVIDGLMPGDEVVVRGQTLLEDKSPVKVVSTVPALDSLDVVE